MKDWTGNKNSVFKTLGASNHTDKDRETNDYYATHPSAIDKLKAEFNIPNLVWEPACGEGHLSKRLIETGHSVFSSDLIDRGYGEVLDFLSIEAYQYQGNFPCILTNPPFRYATEFVLRALDLLPNKGCACFLLKTTALEGKNRYESIYRNSRPHYVFQFIERLLCAKNGDFDGMVSGGGSAVAYSWFVFEKGYKGETILEWI